MRSVIARSGAARLASLAVITFSGFFLLGYGGILVTGGNSHQASPVWPATAEFASDPPFAAGAT